MDERVLIGLFARGLPNKDMRKQVQISRPKDLDEALVVALTCEAVDETSESERPHKPKPSTGSVASVKGKGKGGKVPQKNKVEPTPAGQGPVAPIDSKGDLQLAQVLQNMTEMMSRLAGKQGAARPPVNPQQGNTGPGQGAPRPRVPLSEVRCYGCNQMGHYRSQCPERAPAAYGGQVPGNPPMGGWPEANQASTGQAGGWPQGNPAPPGQATGRWPQGGQTQGPQAPVDYAPQEWEVPKPGPLN